MIGVRSNSDEWHFKKPSSRTGQGLSSSEKNQRTTTTRRLEFDVEPVQIHEVYRHARVGLQTNILPSRNVYAADPTSSRRPGGETKRAAPRGKQLSPRGGIQSSNDDEALLPLLGCPFFSPQILCDAASAVANVAVGAVHIAQDVGNVAVDAIHVVKALATGSLSYDGNLNVIDVDLSVSGSASSSSYSGEPTYFHRPSIEMDGLTIKANASFVVTLQYNFVIEDYSIQNITAILHSTLEAAIHAS